MQRLLPITLATSVMIAAVPAIAQVTGPAGGTYSAPPMVATAPQPVGHVHPTDEAGTPFTNALNLLEAQGYTGITDFRAEGQQFAATATYDGQRVSVLVDPVTRRIQRRS